MEKLENADRYQNIFSFAIAVGETMLHSGGETYRVEETIGRILEAYGIEEYNVFVMAHGIMANIYETRSERGFVVRNVPLGRFNLEKVSLLNQLSREICEQDYPIEKAWGKLEEYRAIPDVSLRARVWSSGLGCASICYCLGGRPLEIALAGALGMLLQACMWLGEQKQVSFYVAAVLGPAFVTAFTQILLEILEMPIRLNEVITGTIVLLVPGVSMAYSIRDLFMANYLSGMVRLMDALVTGVCIAVGVAASMSIIHFFGA